jgi:hypothetical protein
LIVAQRTSTLFNDILNAPLLLTAHHSAQAPLPPNGLLDDLLDSAPPLVAAMDNLATQVYGTSENPSHLNEARDEFARALIAVITAVKSFWKGKEDPDPASEKGSRAYFTEQFVQLNVAVESVQWAAIPT